MYSKSSLCKAKLKHICGSGYIKIKIKEECVHGTRMLPLPTKIELYLPFVVPNNISKFGLIWLSHTRVIERKP